MPLPTRPPEPPAAMRTAVGMMWAGAGLTVLSAVVFLASTDQFAEALTDATGVTNQFVIDQAVDEARSREIFRTIVGVALWSWMAVKNGQGRRWARVVATVFGVINVLGLLLGGLVLGGTGSADIETDELIEYLLPQLVLGVGIVVLGLVILFQLYRSESSRYYDESTRFQAALALRGYT
jgi:hypothetical protein